jgi:hypothetical protein
VTQSDTGFTLTVVPPSFGEQAPGMSFVALFKPYGRRVWHIERFGAASCAYWFKSLCGYEDADNCLEFLSGYCAPDWPGLGGALRPFGIGTLDAPDSLCLRCRDSWLRWYGRECIDPEEVAEDDLQAL